MKLATFRYPAATPERKGVVHFVNGYADYCARYAFFAHHFAQAGYDFVCMDPRGFGHSEGKRGFIESEEAILEDYIRFNELVDERFGGKDVPKLQLGFSLGGLLSLKMSVLKPSYFKGTALITPYL